MNNLIKLTLLVLITSNLVFAQQHVTFINPAGKRDATSAVIIPKQEFLNEESSGEFTGLRVIAGDEYGWYSFWQCPIHSRDGEVDIQSKARAEKATECHPIILNPDEEIRKVAPLWINYEYWNVSNDVFFSDDYQEKYGPIFFYAEDLKELDRLATLSYQDTKFGYEVLVTMLSIYAGFTVFNAAEKVIIGGRTMIQSSRWGNIIFPGTAAHMTRELTALSFIFLFDVAVGLKADNEIDRQNKRQRHNSLTEGIGQQEENIEDELPSSIIVEADSAWDYISGINRVIKEKSNSFDDTYFDLLTYAIIPRSDRINYFRIFSSRGRRSQHTFRQDLNRFLTDNDITDKEVNRGLYQYFDKDTLLDSVVRP